MSDVPDNRVPVRTRTSEWSRMVAASLTTSGVWPTYYNLVQTRRMHPDDLALRGYAELVRALIVRDLMNRTKGGAAVPSRADEFTKNYAHFNLNAQEGYLISLIDGQLSIQKLLQLSPSDHFTTLFNIAKLEQMKAISLPQ